MGCCVIKPGKLGVVGIPDEEQEAFLADFRSRWVMLHNETTIQSWVYQGFTHERGLLVSHKKWRFVSPNSQLPATVLLTYDNDRSGCSCCVIPEDSPRTCMC
jgi:hypothetical protein